MSVPAPWKHQEYSTQFLLDHHRVFDMSDAGTGKTRAHIDAFAQRRHRNGNKALILAPLSILQSAWGDDIERFRPELRYVIASASNRTKAFATDADVYITNHDAAKYLAEHKQILKTFDTLVIDESPAYKHATSQRSKAIRAIKDYFAHRAELTATPNSNSVLDFWHQALLLDDGERLGTSFYRFRDAVCTPTQIGPSRDMIEWRDKPGAETAVAQLLADITIRHLFEDCHDIPPNTKRHIKYYLGNHHRILYETLKKQCLLDLQSDKITAVHAGALANKLLQLCSGAVYNDSGGYSLIDEGRYDLILHLVMERPHSLVAFNWRHQRDEISSRATKLGIPHAIIDGEVDARRDRPRIVKEFQDGRYRFLLIHPQSGAHGLTLTRGTASIWASPTYNAEHFIQFNRRIYRAGQTQPTETILVTADDTIEEHTYARLLGKIEPMSNFLDILRLDTLSKAA